ncbi:hypothetical protein [Streptomyces sp. NPDC058632]|uniref:hypothetical protein n=1 Tax=Streptomyces sp. NPDC058632 TaxID=3346567 RepID=UPI003664CD52
MRGLARATHVRSTPADVLMGRYAPTIQARLTPGRPERAGPGPPMPRPAVTDDRLTPWTSAHSTGRVSTPP